MSAITELYDQDYCAWVLKNAEDQRVRLIPHRDFDFLLQAFFHDSRD